MAAQVGALRVTLGANTAQYEAGMRRAQSQARMTGQNISTSMTRAQMATTRAFAGMKQAALGFGGAFLFAGIAGFVGMGKAALDYAANLGETSQQIGVTVEQLQILSRISVQNNVTTETMQRALQRLNRTLGEAKAGVVTAVRAFTGLGFSREQLNAFNQGGDALRDVAEHIMAIPDPARQAAAANQLFGRSGQQLMPTLRAIAEGYDEAASEAQRMGLVTEEQAAKADELADEFALMSEVLRTRLAIAMAEGTGGIRQFTVKLGDAIDWVGRMTSNVYSVADAFSAWTDRVHLTVASLSPLIGRLIQTDEIMARIAARQGALADSTVEGLRGVVDFVANRNAPARPAVGPVDFSLATGGGSRRSSGDAERARQKALRDEAEYQSDLRRFRTELLRAQQEQVVRAGDRLQIDAQILDIEREQYVADLQLQVSLKELTQARAQELQLAYDRVDEERRQSIALEQMREVDAEAREIASVRRDIEAGILRQEADMADTAAERRESELRLLELAHRHERARLEAVEADETASAAAVEEARLRLAALDSWQRREAQIVRMRTMGPMESFLDRLPTTAARANEALQAVTVDGLQGLEDGLVGLLDGTKSVADAFSDMAKSIIADLIRIQIQRAVIAPLANALGGSIGGGGFDYLGAAMNLAPGAFASGGSFKVGGTAGRDRNLLSLNGVPVAKVSQGETVGVGWGGGGGGGPITVNQTYAFQGVAITQDEFVQGLILTKAETVRAINDSRRRGG